MMKLTPCVILFLSTVGSYGQDAGKKDKIESFSKEDIIIGDFNIPISRIYKKSVLQNLPEFERK